MRSFKRWGKTPLSLWPVIATTPHIPQQPLNVLYKFLFSHCIVYLTVLGFELRALGLVGKCSTSELHTQDPKFLFSFTYTCSR